MSASKCLPISSGSLLSMILEDIISLMESKLLHAEQDHSDNGDSLSPQMWTCYSFLQMSEVISSKLSSWNEHTLISHLNRSGSCLREQITSTLFINAWFLTDSLLPCKLFYEHPSFLRLGSGAIVILSDWWHPYRFWSLTPARRYSNTEKSHIKWQSWQTYDVWVIPAYMQDPWLHAVGVAVIHIVPKSSPTQ